MDRYSLPKQVNRLLAVFQALGLLWLYIPLYVRTAPATAKFSASVNYSLAIVFLAILALAVALLFQGKLLRWTLDRRPFLGSLYLGIIYIYLLAVGLMFFVDITYNQSVAFIENFYIPILYQAWFFPFTLAALILSTIIFGFLFKYLGARRDYF